MATSRVSRLSALTKPSAPVSPEKADVQKAFNEAADAVLAAAKCTPDDSDELEEEKTMWMKEWVVVTVRERVHPRRSD
jgi:hypothetical protein